jgi:BirA family transcriptional regulator, biotin operon repressor / biotin---[acetyl-CoA-carboxylase] ligase
MRADDDTPAQAARKPLDAAYLRDAAIRRGGLWHVVEVTERTGSTNADLLDQARDGAPEGLVLAAEEQSAGRGRMGRSWVSPPRAALMFSVLLRPGAVPPGAPPPGAVPPGRRGWLPLLAGLAVAEAVTATATVQTRLKWPNDLLAGPAKLGGILAEASGDAIVVGIGLNVSTEPAELPPPGPGGLPATSLRAAGAPDQPREPLLLAILASLERWYQAWRQAVGDPDRSGLRAGYVRYSGTIGRRIRAELPDGQLLSGLAVGVDSDGRLLVRVSSGAELPVAAADVVHLR